MSTNAIKYSVWKNCVKGEEGSTLYVLLRQDFFKVLFLLRLEGGDQKNEAVKWEKRDSKSEEIALEMDLVLEKKKKMCVQETWIKENNILDYLSHILKTVKLQHYYAYYA